MNIIPKELEDIILGYKKDLENEEICYSCQKELDEPDYTCDGCKKGYCEHYYANKIIMCSKCNEIFCLETCGKFCKCCSEDICSICIGGNDICDDCYELQCN